MNNIFENAKFGDKFRTRDGRMAIFIQSYKSSLEIRNELCIEDKEVCRRFYLYKDDGSFYHKECNEDIVSCWQEPINEELKELAAHFADDEMKISIPERNGRYAGFIAGYRKALEGII